jgi:hypothetical protein
MKLVIEPQETAIPGPADRLDLHREQLQMILQQLPAALLVAQAPSGAMVFVSEDACRLLGRSAGELSASLEPGALRRDGSPYPPGEFPLTRSIANWRCYSSSLGGAGHGVTSTSDWIRSPLGSLS